MAIYTRFGTAVKITEARIIPVWIVNTGHEIKWFFRTPKTKRGWEVEEQPIWFFKGQDAADGHPLCDGKWINANSLRADEGWKEITAELHRINEIDVILFNQWNKAGAAEASAFFDRVDERQVA